MNESSYYRESEGRERLDLLPPEVWQNWNAGGPRDPLAVKSKAEYTLSL